MNVLNNRLAELIAARKWAETQVSSPNPAWVIGPCKRLISASKELEALTPGIPINTADSLELENSQENGRQS